MKTFPFWAMAFILASFASALVLSGCGDDDEDSSSGDDDDNNNNDDDDTDDDANDDDDDDDDDDVVIPADHTLVVIGQADHKPTEELDAFVDSVGQAPAGFMYYFPMDSVDSLVSMGEWMTWHLSQYPGAVAQVGVVMGTSKFWSMVDGSPAGPGAAAILRGEYDSQLDALSQWLNTTDHFVYLRLGLEFDLLGGQWSSSPEEFQAAYRYMVDRLRAHGVDNVAYIWHSAGAFFRDILGIGPSLAAFYPGDDYVDYFGISYWGELINPLGFSTGMTRALYEKRTRELLNEARGMGLELVIAESTPAYVGTTSGRASLEWYKNYFALIEEYDIRMASLISIPWGQEERWTEWFWFGFWPADARLQADPKIVELFLNKVTEERYLMLEDMDG